MELSAGTGAWRNKPGASAGEQIAKWGGSAEFTAMCPLWRYPESELTGQTLNGLENGFKLKQEVTNVILVQAEGSLSFSVVINVFLLQTRLSPV